MVEIIPQDCISILPLSAEPILSWSEKGELAVFLTRLYELGGYSSYGKHLLEEGKKSWCNTAVEFQENARKAKPAPDAEKRVEPIPDFVNDANFGLMAKYSTAWDGVDSTVLSEGAFSSLAHVLEARTDLDASILLASTMYYKQSLQMLRNYLEGMVLQLYFCHNQSDFAKWKRGGYKIPPLRGRNGVLSSLETKRLLTSDLTKSASDLYGDLNGSIHGVEKRLVHAGLFEGKWAGLIFKYDRLQEWCKYFARCVDLGIHILRLSTNLWGNKRPKDRIQCEICHNETDFEINKSRFEGFVKVTCLKCGRTLDYKAELATQQRY